MYLSLSHLPRTVIIDTMCILNAALVGNSTARSAIRGLRKLGFTPAVDERILKEARDKLTDKARYAGTTDPPLSAIEECIDALSIWILPHALINRFSRVNPNDQHIAAAAYQHSAWVLTSDSRLVSELSDEDIYAQLPWAVVDALSDDPSLSHICTGVAIHPERGTVFARVLPDAWGGSKNVGVFTVCEIENIGRLSYDTFCEHWIFESAARKAVVLPAKLQREDEWLVCATYNLPRSKNRKAGSIRLYAKREGDAHFDHQSESTLNRITAKRSGEATIGHTITRKQHFCGIIRRVVFGPNTIRKRTLEYLARIPEGAPDPYDEDSLSVVLRRYAQAQELGGLLPPKF